MSKMDAQIAYWSTRDFCYFRDHEKSGAWGVRDTRSGRTVAIGMDKNEALMLALFMDGKIEQAVKVRDDMRDLFARYPELDK